MDNYNYKNFKPTYYDLANFPGPKAGEKFIDLTLVNIDGKEVKLSSFLNKPIIIETGSITCPMYVKCIDEMDNMRQDYSNVHFLMIYVREAHPGERTREHKSMQEKLQQAKRLPRLYSEKRTILSDSLDGKFHLKYGGLPNMVYVINMSGIVLFRGDWNNTEKLREVLTSINQSKIDNQEHFEPAKPSPPIAIKVLYQGGFIAIWDFIKGLRDLLQLHKKANEMYKNKS